MKTHGRGCSQVVVSLAVLVTMLAGHNAQADGAAGPEKARTHMTYEELSTRISSAFEPRLQKIVAASSPQRSWSMRTSLPMPHSWPPKGEGVVDIEIFAGALSMEIRSGELQSAPWARATINVVDGKITEIKERSSTIRGANIQGVRPLSDPEGMSKRLDRATQRMLDLAQTNGLPSPEIREEIRQGYCEYLGMNGVIKEKLIDLYPAFFRWLGCS